MVVGFAFTLYVPDFAVWLGWVETERAKLWLCFVGMLFTVAGEGWWTYGPSLWEIPQCISAVVTAEGEDTEDGRSTHPGSAAVSNDNVIVA